MADANAGTLSVAITGDISDLLAALQQAQDAATAAGQQIAQALEAPSQQLNFDFGEQIATQFQDAEGAAQTAGTAIADALAPISTDAQQATTALDDLNDSLNQQSDAAESLSQLGISLTDAGDAATTAAPEINEASDATNNLSNSATEAESGLAQMVEQLTTLGEALAITEGMKELGQEALTVYSQVQNVSTALQFMGDSSEQAEAAINNLKTAALAINEPIGVMLSDAQKIPQSLGGFDAAIPIFTAAADASKTMGLDFDSVVQKMENMALSGAASAKALSTMRVSTDDLATAINTIKPGMDATGTSAATMFKALDPGQRLQVLISALGQYAGASAAFSGNLADEWTHFQNLWDNVMDEAGKALAPFASDLAGFLSSVVGSIQGLIEQFDLLPKPIQDLIVGAGLVAAAAVPVTGALAAWGLAVNGLSQVVPAVSNLIGTFGEEAGTAATAVSTASTAVGDLNEAATTLQGASAAVTLVKDMEGAAKDAAPALDDAAKAAQGLGEAATVAVGSSGGTGILGLISAAGGIAVVLSGAAAAFIATENQIGTLKQKYDDMIADIQRQKIVDALNSGESIQALTDMAGSADNLKTAIEGAGAAFQTAGSYVTNFGVEISTTATVMGNLAAQATLDHLSQLTKNLQDAKTALDNVTTSGNAAGLSVGQIAALQTALTASQNAYNAAIGVTTKNQGEFVQSTKGSADATNEVNDALLQIASNFGKLTPIQVAWNAAQEKNAQQIHGAMTDYDQWNQDLQQIATGGLPQVITGYDNWNESLNNLGGTLTTSGTQSAFVNSQLGLLKNGIVVLTGAASDSKVKFDAFGLAIGTAGQTVVETNGKITNLAGAVALANADWEASASKIYDAKAALDSFNSSSDAAQEAMTGVSTAGMSDVDAFNAISNAAQAAMGSVDDLTDSMDAAIDAENSLDDSGGMGGGGGGGGKGGGGNTDVMTLQSMLQAGALGSQVSMAAQMMGLVQVGNQAFETIAAYNDELKATGSSLQLVQDAAGQFVLEEQNATTATKNNTTATTANTSATTSNTTATTTASTATGALATAAAGGVPNMIALSDATTATATAAAALTSATTTTTTAVSSLGDAATTAAGDTGQSYEQLAANLKKFGSVVTDGTVDLGQLTSALAQLNGNVTEMSVSVQKATSDNAAWDTQTENAISALQAAYEAAGRLSSTLDIINTGLFGFVGSAAFVPVSSTPPNYVPYTEGSVGNTGGPGLYQGNQPGSAPWSPQDSAPTTFQQAMPSMLQINVNSPSAQTTAQSIVSALRNNAGLKV